MSLIQAIVGTLLLVFGRRIFWIFVGVIGFLAGYQWAQSVFAQDNQPLILLLALGTGIIGAVLAIFLQRLAAGIAGFFAGAYLVSAAAAVMSWEGTSLWIFQLIAGILCGILLIMLFDWVLIVLSAFVGANMLLPILPLDSGTAPVAWLVLAGIGIAVQVWQLVGRVEPLAQLQTGRRY